MKLNKHMKDEILRKVMSNKFDTAHEKLRSLSTQLGDDIYNSIEGIETLNKLPVKWFSSVCEIRCYFGGFSSWIPLSSERCVGIDITDRGMKFEKDHDFSIRFRSIEEQKSNLKQHQNDTRSELLNILRGVNTDKQLMALWPEVKQYIPVKCAPPPMVLSLDKLKSLLDEEV